MAKAMALYHRHDIIVNDNKLKYFFSALPKISRKGFIKSLGLTLL
jgi:hypothetical protein